MPSPDEEYGKEVEEEVKEQISVRRSSTSACVVTFSGDVRSSKAKGDPYASPSRTESRDDRGPTDDELNETLASADPRRRDRDRRRRHRPDPYYDGYASVYADPYALQRQQYQYYEHLRQTDPQRYMEVYKQIMAGHPPPPPPEYLAAAKISALEGYGSLGYDGRIEERGSVHSGRSSANGLKGTDTYYGYRHDASLRDATSLRTDLSDRELNTDASLNLHLEESTVRSERMTPFKFSTAHIKGSISSRHVVVVRPSYPVDGLPATVQILSLAAAVSGQPGAHELASYPGPLVKGVTHKKTVIEYCAARVRGGGGRGDPVGYALVWELLSLLLRQNGVVVGTDIAELLMKNKRDFELSPSAKSTPNADGRGSSVSEEEAGASHASDLTPPEERSCIDEKTAIDQLREYLTYGNRQEAIEWAMSHKLWGHAFQLAAYGDRRARAAVAARFLAAVPRADPLHSLYHALAGRQPPVATCAADERWGDWRAHAAIILSNASSKPDNETRTLTQLGDSLLSRGLLYSAQFCYLAGRVPFARHPLAPLAPRRPPRPRRRVSRCS
ncbi:protein transport protein Sec16B-like [Choristoneura fumiferana]|uniref:protein transport protein Sec16B-like n=1 Tax=Choristoneura fumiferana TaxID=7141 RepID=UPI003D1564D4